MKEKAKKTASIEEAAAVQEAVVEDKDFTISSPPKFLFSLREDIKNEKQFLPTKGEIAATGYDCRAAQEDRKPIILKPFDKVMIPLGFRSAPENGWWYQVAPRSSTFAKKHLHALYGIVDCNYEGFAMFVCQYIPPMNIEDIIAERIADHHNQMNSFRKVPPRASSLPTLTINWGDAIAQIIPVKRQEMDVAECSNEEYDEYCKVRGGARGALGFGSTDDKRKK